MRYGAAHFETSLESIFKNLVALGPLVHLARPLLLDIDASDEASLPEPYASIIPSGATLDEDDVVDAIHRSLRGV